MFICVLYGVWWSQCNFWELALSTWVGPWGWTQVVRLGDRHLTCQIIMPAHACHFYWVLGVKLTELSLQGFVFFKAKLITLCFKPSVFPSHLWDSNLNFYQCSKDRERRAGPPLPLTSVIPTWPHGPFFLLLMYLSLIYCSIVTIYICRLSRWF